MAKCMICAEEAKYRIKGTSDFYCEDCAQENFSDLSVLEKLEPKKKAEEICEEEIEETFEKILEDDIPPKDPPSEEEIKEDIERNL
jgi:hypothetical protein